MLTINANNLEALSLGATILGSGGGGHPKILYDLIAYLMETHGEARIISIDDLLENDLVVPLAMVGAPLVCMEKIPNTTLLDAIYTHIKRDFPHRRIVLMPAEIGGCNALTPLLLALKYDLPILDADLIGRAFPKLDMCKPAVLGRSCHPTYVSDLMGNSVSLHLTGLGMLEPLIRDITIRFGSSSSIATYLFEGKEAHDYVIENSVSRALSLGEKLLLHHALEATVIGSGIVSDVYHDMKGGFLLGHATIKSKASCFKVHYQNEYLKVSQNDRDIDGSPNIIALIEKKSGLPLTTEALKYGQQVQILSLKAPDFWMTPKAHSVVDYKLLNLESI